MSDYIDRQEIPYFQVSNDLVDGDALGNVYEKMCYVVMARYTNNGQIAFPSYNTIAKNMGVSRNTAIKSIKSLEDKGLLLVSNKFENSVQTTNRYTLNLLRGVQEMHYPSAGDALPPVQEVDTDKEQIKKNKLKTIEKIYTEYPKKVAKKAALKAIEKAIKKIDPDELLEVVKEYANKIAWKETQYIPNPATWFNAEQWEDDQSTWEEPNKKPKFPTFNGGLHESKPDPSEFIL